MLPASSTKQPLRQREAIHRVWGQNRRQASTRPEQRKVPEDLRQAILLTEQQCRPREAIHRDCQQSRASSVHASGTAQGIRGPETGDPSAERLCRQREAIHRVWGQSKASSVHASGPAHPAALPPMGIFSRKGRRAKGFFPGVGKINSARPLAATCWPSQF